MIDPALIRITGFRIGEDRGRLLENVVFLHIRMQKKEIYFHKDKKECDFIIREGNRIIYAIQVTTTLSNEEVKTREINGLIEAMSLYNLQEGTILTENEQGSLEIDGFFISIIPIWKWLLFNPTNSSSI